MKDYLSVEKDFKKKIQTYFEGSEHFVPFFLKNFSLKNYRGNHLLQHERTTKDILLQLIETFYKVSKNDWIIAPPFITRKVNGKTLSDQNPRPGEKYYDEFGPLRKILMEMKKNTIYYDDNKKEFSLKYIKKIMLKNLFDMGFLDCKCISVKNKVTFLSPKDSAVGKGLVHYKPSKFMHDLVMADSDKQKNMMLSKKIKSFFLINSTIFSEIFTDIDIQNKNIKYAHKLEFLTILNYYDGKNYDDVKKAFIEFHSMRKNWIPDIDFLFKDLQKSTKKLGFAKKDGYFDYGNWLNQIETQFSFLKITTNFEFGQNYEKIYYSFNKNNNMPSRSLQTKQNYFKQHKFTKGENFKIFELHHIYPIALAEDSYEFKLIDSWENLIYISPNKHAAFPKRNNPFTNILKLNEKEISFGNKFLENQINVENNKDCKYNPNLIDKILKYNKMLNKTEI